MGNEFQSLHPLLRHHLVNTLGWKSLRPLQEQTIPPITSGNHTLVLAPTAGGKTEAATFPLISRLLHEGWDGTCILYICPLKALLNNLAERLATYYEMVGYKSALWHGDINDGRRKRILNEQPACLLTTPESIESLLVSTRLEAKNFLANVRAVVIDEIHAFAGDDRGTHLLCLIERLSAQSTHVVQRIGLSATVGNPENLLGWLTCGKDSERSTLVTLPGNKAETEVKIDYVGNLDNAALVISKLFRGEKRLVFCDSRRRVEELTQMLSQMGIDVYASHSSLSLENRRISEEAFAEGADCVIVATSTLELGLDVGDLDRVIQIDAPGSVASFLQRLGRTGRRSNTIRNCLFLATSEESLLKAAAIVELWDDGFIEPIVAPVNPYHIIAQQILAICLQQRRSSEPQILKLLGHVPGIREIGAEGIKTLIQDMLKASFLIQENGFFLIGPSTEKRFGRRHYLELLSVFSSPQSFEVLEGKRSIGFVDWLSLMIPDGQERKPLILAGKSWDIGNIEWGSRQVFVTQSEERGRTRWHGKAIGLGFYVAQKIHQILTTHFTSNRWTQRAFGNISSQREELAELASMKLSLYKDEVSRNLIFPTFFGSTLNALIATALEDKFGVSARSDDFQITIRGIEKHGDIARFIKNEIVEYFHSQFVISDEAQKLIKFSECLSAEKLTQTFLGKIGTIQEALKSLMAQQIKPPQ